MTPAKVTHPECLAATFCCMAGDASSARDERTSPAWGDRRPTADPSRRGLRGGVLADEQQVDVDHDIPADGVAAARQLRLPFEAVLATVDARLELEPTDLAEAAHARQGVMAVGADRARDAADRQLAVDLRAAGVGQADGRRSERDLGVVLDVEEGR